LSNIAETGISNRCRREQIANSKDESPLRTIRCRLKRTKRRFEERIGVGKKESLWGRKNHRGEERITVGKKESPSGRKNWRFEECGQER